MEIHKGKRGNDKTSIQQID